MTGVTTGQTALTTATDSDDTEVYLTTGLVAALQALANLFESATGHAHTGAGHGAPIGTAGIASGITLTSPHMTGAVVDSGGLTVTAGGLTVAAGGLTLTAAPLIIGTATAASGYIRLPNNNTINWRNAANASDLAIGFDASDRLLLTATAVSATASAGGGQAVPATVNGYLTVNLNGSARQIPYFN